MDSGLVLIAIVFIIGILLAINLQKRGKTSKNVEVSKKQPSGKVDEVQKSHKRESTEISQNAKGSLSQCLKLAVRAVKQLNGSLTFKGEDSNGSHYNIEDITQPAILYVPKETLPLLKKNTKIWSRVINPDVTSDKVSAGMDMSKVGADGSGLIASLLAGPLMAAIEAESTLMSSGQLKIDVVETYFNATTAIKFEGLLGM